MRLGTRGGRGSRATVLGRNRMRARGQATNGERSTSARRDFATLSGMV